MKDVSPEQREELWNLMHAGAEYGWHAIGGPEAEYAVEAIIEAGWRKPVPVTTGGDHLREPSCKVNTTVNTPSGAHVSVEIEIPESRKWENAYRDIALIAANTADITLEKIREKSSKAYQEEYE